MYKNAVIVFIPLLIFFFSCNSFERNKKNAVNNKFDRQLIDTTFKLDIFTSLPDTLN